MSASISTTGRKLFVHPAHRGIGVSDAGIDLHPYSRIDGLADAWDCGRTKWMTVVLLRRRDHADARHVSAMLEQYVAERYGARCSIADLDGADYDPSTLRDADCVIAVDRGIRITQHWVGDCPDFHVTKNVAVPRDVRLVEVSVVSSARWHPILNGVGPFVSNNSTALQGPAETFFPPDDAVVLLTAPDNLGRARPVAWANRGRQGRAFSTVLGSSADLRHSAFCRLIENAVAWTAESGQSP